MKKVEMFFDYNCPYCLKGYDGLVEFMRDKPNLEVVWHPCEISVYKDPSEPTHSDISLQAMFFATDNNVDLWGFHKKVYDMVFRDRLNTHDVDTFVNALEGLLDVQALRQALKSGKYIERLKEANHYAFKKTGVHVVPTYRADDGYLQDRQEFFGLGDSDTGYGFGGSK